MPSLLHRLLASYENAAAILPDMLKRWSAVDEELRDHHAEQFEWLVTSLRRRLDEAASIDERDALRIDSATSTLARYSSQIEHLMGFSPLDVLPIGYGRAAREQRLQSSTRGHWGIIRSFSVPDHPPQSSVPELVADCRMGTWHAAVLGASYDHHFVPMVTWHAAVLGASYDHHLVPRVTWHAAVLLGAWDDHHQVPQSLAAAQEPTPFCETRSVETWEAVLDETWLVVDVAGGAFAPPTNDRDMLFSLGFEEAFVPSSQRPDKFKGGVA